MKKVPYISSPCPTCLCIRLWCKYQLVPMLEALRRERSEHALALFSSATAWGETRPVSPSLFGHPTSCDLERDDFLEIMQCIQGLLEGQWLLCPTLPHGLVQCPNDQVIIANDVWLLLHEKGGQKM